MKRFVRTILSGSVCVGFVTLLVFGGIEIHGVGQENAQANDGSTQTPEEKATTLRIREIMQISSDYASTTETLRQQIMHLQKLNLLGYNVDVALTGVKVVGGFNYGDEFVIPPRVSPEEQALMVTAGHIRASTCANVLLNRITNNSGTVSNVWALPSYTLAFTGDYAAFESLRKIGEPACHAALVRIPAESDELKRILMTVLLHRCLGDTKGRSWLTELLEKTSDPTQRDRVAAAIAQIDQGPCPMDLRAYVMAKRQQAK